MATEFADTHVSNGEAIVTLARQFVILIAIGASVAAAVVWDVPGFSSIAPGNGDTESSAPVSEAPAPVFVTPVSLRSSAAVVEAVGTGEAIRAITLYPEAAGQVTEILFSAGEWMSSGDPLLRLDSEDDALAVELARVHLEDARQQLARYENTAPGGAVSISEVDRARTALSAARIELAQAQLALRKRTVRAPFDGVISIADVSVGDRVTTSSVISTLDDRSTLLVDFEIPEAFAQGVVVGGEVSATTWALSGEQFVGIVDSVASRIDAQTRTLRVRARIDNPGDVLRTGMSFTIVLPLMGERFPSVPSISVQWDRRGAYVWRVSNGVAERVDVQVLKREEQWILVDAPLAAGNQIVVEGVQRLRPGRAVDVTLKDALADNEGRDDA